MFESTKRFALFYQMFDVIQIVSNTIKQGAQTGKCLLAILAELSILILHSVTSEVYFRTAKMHSLVICQDIHNFVAALLGPCFHSSPSARTRHFINYFSIISELNKEFPAI